MDDTASTNPLLDQYKREIQLYEKDFAPWERRCRKIIKRYRDDRAETNIRPAKFNILYSNVQTLSPAAYGNKPKPDIERRFKDDDNTGRVVSDVLERCTSYFIEDKFDATMREVVQDRLLPGRGVAWTRYVPHMREIDAPDGLQITDDTEAENEKIEEVYYEEVLHDYVHWKDFGHNVARTWEETYLVWRIVYLTKEEITERFGKEIAAKCPLNYSPKGLSDEKKDEPLKKSVIYEMWDKNTKKASWVHKDVPEFLDQKDDPLRLPNFYPCPRPLYAIMTNEALIPVPDFVEYQDQANELDELTSRISSITRSIKVAGVYDASADGVQQLLNEGVENMLIPVKQWAIHGDKGGLKGVIDLLPVQEIAQTLLVLYQARDKVKQDLYEITGIADIIRGASVASETATAQSIKSKFATLRLDELQKGTAHFACELVRNTAFIIAEHFSIDTIKKISGVKLFTAAEKQQIQMQQQQYQMLAQQAEAMQQPPPPPPPIDDKTKEMLEAPTWEEVEAILRDEPTLCFRVDIETDSTIKIDEQEDKASRIEFLQASGTFLQQAAQNPNPELTPLLIQMLLFGIRGFKIGKTVEGTFRTILADVEKAAKAPKEARPDPEMERLKADMQLQQQRLQNDKEIASEKLKVDIAIAQEDAMIEKNKAIAEDQRKRDADVTDAAIEREKSMRQFQIQEEELRLEYDLKNKIEMVKLAITREQSSEKESESESEPIIESSLAPMIEVLQQMISMPKEVTSSRDANGNLTAQIKPMMPRVN
jgi:uncharacterized protein YqgV (UPF0045/DUF77 family)